MNCPREPSAQQALSRVVVVDDDEDTRLYFRNILESADEFKFAGDFTNASEALNGIPRLQPDLVLIDIRLPDLNGIECTKRLKQKLPGLKIVIATGLPGMDWIITSLQAGADACLVKPVHAHQCLATLRYASAGKAANRTLHMLNGTNGCSPTKWRETGAPLSLRENEVLGCLAEGLLYKEISDRLRISYAAVHKYQHKIFLKLHVSNRSEAIRVWMSISG